MSVTDVTQHLNDLSLRLQGEDQTVLELFMRWKGFESKLDIYCSIKKKKTQHYYRPY